MDSRVAALSKVGPSLADLLMDVFCFAASPSFKGAADLVDGARRKFSRARQVSADLPGGGGDLGGQLTRRLAERVASAYRDCRERNVDSSYLAIAETEVQILIAEATDEDLVVLSAVRDPEGFAAFLRRRAAGRRGLIEEEAEPYFDALIRALAAVYVEMAPWSRDFVVVALKSLLAQGISIASVLEEQSADHQEMRQMLMQIRDVQADILRAIEQLNSGARPGRLLFGGRPDVAFGFRERVEQGRLRGLVVDERRERTVLLGMAGCGKSQLASSLAQWCGAAGWGLVAWLNASSAASVRSDLVELARQLGIDTSDKPTEDEVIRRCLDYLQSADAADRLVVFDNVEDFEDLAGVVPRGDGLRVVATSRRRDVSSAWKEVKVDVFPRPDSIAFVQSIMGTQDEKAADAVAERLGDLPLALAQAAETARIERWALAEYLDQLDAYASDRVIRRIPDDSYADDVSIALLMAADSALSHLKGDSRDAARRQLGALAVLAESGVPTRWIDPRAEDNKAGKDAGADETNEDTGAGPAGEDAKARDAAAGNAHLALTALLNASVVQQSADGDVTMLHRLQGQVLRENWNPEEWTEARQAAVHYLTASNDPSYNTSNKFSAQRAQASEKHRETSTATRAPLSDLVDDRTGAETTDHNILTMVQITDLSDYESELRITRNETITQLCAIANQPDSQTLLQRREIAIVLPDTLKDIVHLEMQYKALELGKAIRNTCAALEKGDPLLFSIRNSLALAYQNAGKVREAVTLFEEVLREAADTDPNTLLSIRNSLALAYQNAGRAHEAIGLFEEILREIADRDSPAVLSIRNSLALAYQNVNRFEESIPLLEDNLRDYIRTLGDDHHYTQIARNNLAHTYRMVGRYDESIQMLQTAHAALLQSQYSHPHTLVVKENLALAQGAEALTQQNKIGVDNTISSLQDCLEEHLKTLGPDHPYTLTARNNLASALQDAGRSEESIRLLRQSLKEHIRVLDPDHPYTLTARNNLASALVDQGKHEEAIRIFKRCIEEYQRILYSDHHEILTVRNSLSVAYRESRDYEKALTECRANLRECRRILEPTSPQFAQALHNLALIYCGMGKRTDAIVEFNAILDACKRDHGLDHPLTNTVRSILDTLCSEVASDPASSPESSEE